MTGLLRRRSQCTNFVFSCIVRPSSGRLFQPITGRRNGVTEPTKHHSPSETIASQITRLGHFLIKSGGKRPVVPYAAHDNLKDRKEGERTRGGPGGIKRGRRRTPGAGASRRRYSRVGTWWLSAGVGSRQKCVVAASQRHHKMSKWESVSFIVVLFPCDSQWFLLIRRMSRATVSRMQKIPLREGTFGGCRTGTVKEVKRRIKRQVPDECPVLPSDNSDSSASRSYLDASSRIKPVQTAQQRISLTLSKPAPCAHQGSSKWGRWSWTD